MDKNTHHNCNFVAEVLLFVFIFLHKTGFEQARLYLEAALRDCAIRILTCPTVYFVQYFII